MNDNVIILTLWTDYHDFAIKAFDDNTSLKDTWELFSEMDAIQDIAMIYGFHFDVDANGKPVWSYGNNIQCSCKDIIESILSKQRKS